MKAVIIAAGKGKRLMPITSSRPKPMIPMAGKPLLEHTILGLKSAGISEILLIVGYKEDIIRDYFGDGKENFNLRIEYIVQNEQLGTAHAFGFAKKFVGENAVLLMYGDLLVEPKVYQEIVQKFNENKIEGILLLKKVKNPEEFGIISLNSNGLVEKIVEKPPREMNLGNLANAGVFLFDSKIFKAIEKTEKSIRGEYEFTDSMEILINRFKGKIAGFRIKNYFWSDIGLPWQFKVATNYFLDKVENKVIGKIEKNVQVSGNVYIGEGTNILSGSHIQGPCYIGKNNVIGPNSFIKAYTYIANDCQICRSEIKNSIIFSNTTIPHSNYVGDSIVCENVNLGTGTKLSTEDQADDLKGRKFVTIIGPNVKTGANVNIMKGIIIRENSKIGDRTIVREDVPPNTLYYHDPNKGIIKKSL